ncbi:thiaminase II [Marinomonas sp.]|uniref:thiaminase II n=1 Tax=Marinomonas sp. TaxID=1904862 RepID=UPI003C707CF9
MQYQDLIDACQTEWQAYTKHDFVTQLASGNLPKDSFLHYLKQDFLFLKQYARAYALAVYKASSLTDMRQALPTLNALLSSEISHHVNFCQDWGLTENQMEQEREDFGTLAYTRYVLDAGMSGNLVDLYAALAPCSIGYAVIGEQISLDANTQWENNPYRSWIELYAGDDYQGHAKQGALYFNTLLKNIDINSERGQQLIEVFCTATRMEVAFWQQGLNASR